MSYRQLASMAPTTLSVHLVLAIIVKTHFAKDVFNRCALARPTWQRRLAIIRRSTNLVDSSASHSLCPPRRNASAFPVPIYLVQSDSRVLTIVTYLLRNK